jgi:hypothetical protein
MELTLPPDDPRNPKSKKKSNLADGRESYDSTSTGELIQFFNKNVTPYPTEVGGPAFDLIPVRKAKRHHGQCGPYAWKQEYNRIMELVECYNAKQMKLENG